MSGKKKVPGVYVIANPEEQRAYVGSSVDLVVRLKRHEYLLRNDDHTNYGLQRAFNKGHQLSCTIIPLKPGESTIEVEQQILDEFKDQGVLYNVALDATAPMLGRKASPETIAKRVEALTGQKRSDEVRQRMSIASKGNNLGMVHTAEFRAAIGDRFRGVPLSEEHKTKLSAHFKGYDFGPEHRKKSLEQGILEGNPVVCDGVEYPGLRTAARDLQLPRSTVQARIDSRTEKFADWFRAPLKSE